MLAFDPFAPEVSPDEDTAISTNPSESPMASISMRETQSMYAKALRDADVMFSQPNKERHVVPYFSANEKKNAPDGANSLNVPAMFTAIGWKVAKPTAARNDGGWFLPGNQLAIRKVLGGTCMGVRPATQNGISNKISGPNTNCRSIEVILELGAYLVLCRLLQFEGGKLPTF
jgi:hypothetical protein